MIVNVNDINPPPPIPCNARNTINWPIDCATPHNADATTKITIADWYTRLRP